MLYTPGAFWDKVIDFTDEPVVKSVENTLLHNGDNDDRK